MHMLEQKLVLIDSLSGFKSFNDNKILNVQLMLIKIVQSVQLMFSILLTLNGRESFFKRQGSEINYCGNNPIHII
jgi:hypothetical protein